MSDAFTIACALVRHVEGLRLDAYHDTTGRLTIGYGNTCMLDGSPVTAGCRLANGAEADALFMSTLHTIQPKLLAMVHVPLLPCQEGALLSFGYNVGMSALHGSTLLKKLNHGDTAGAATQFLIWDMAGGHYSRGLANRREIERVVFLGKVNLAGPVEPTTTTDSLNAGELAKHTGATA